MSASDRVSGRIRGFLASIGALVLASSAWSVGSAGVPADTALSSERVSLYANPDGSTPTSEAVKFITITNAGDQTLNWSIPPSDAPGDAFIVLSSRLGTVPAHGTGTIGVGADTSKGSVGGQTGHFTIWDVDAVQPLHTVEVFLRLCRGVCVSVDLSDVKHTVSPLLFGGQVDWLNSGGYVWNTPANPSCSAPGQSGGAPRPGIVNQLLPLGIRMLRYPSGTPADFFKWYQALFGQPAALPAHDYCKEHAISSLSSKRSHI